MHHLIYYIYEARLYIRVGMSVIYNINLKFP